MINASGQMVVNGNVPFSEVIAAWYQANNYEWERLLVDSGKFQLVRSCNEPKEIATANTVLRVARTLLNEIDTEDNIPFYDQFVKDVEKLEKVNGVLDPNSELRNDIVTFISENYTPREAGHLICPACLTETPNALSICIRCHGSLVSWGEKAAKQDESTAPGMPERERQESGDGTEDEEENVEMENEIDWSESRREQQGKNQMMTSICQTRSRAEHRLDLEAIENVLLQTTMWHSAPTPKNSRKRRTNESPMNKNKTKSRGKPD